MVTRLDKKLDEYLNFFGKPFPLWDIGPNEAIGLINDCLRLNKTVEELKKKYFVPKVDKLL